MAIGQAGPQREAQQRAPKMQASTTGATRSAFMAIWEHCPAAPGPAGESGTTAAPTSFSSR